MNPIVDENADFKETMRIIDKTALGIGLIQNDKNQIIGVVTDGDIRRALLDGKDLNEPIKSIIKKDFIWVKKNTPKSKITSLLNKHKISQIPELDENKKLVKVHTFHSLQEKSTEVNRSIKKVLVIGGAGYVGHHVIDLLLDTNFEVRCLDLELYSDEDGIKHKYYDDRVEQIQGDMRSIEDLITAIQDIDAVIHLGAIVGDPASKENPKDAIGSNYLSAALIANTCKYFQINRLIFISTCSVYGHGDQILDENSVLDPVSLYGRNKVDAENAILNLSDQNFRPTILRFGTIFGVSGRMRFDLVINLLTAKATLENEITIYGGSQWRPFVHVRDAARSVIKCLDSPIDIVGNEIYNIGCNDYNYQIKDLIPIYEDIFENLDIKIFEDVEDIRDYRVDFTKVKNQLNFECEISIKDGINEMKNYILNYDIDYRDSRYSNVKSLEKELDPKKYKAIS